MYLLFHYYCAAWTVKNLNLPAFAAGKVRPAFLLAALASISTMFLRKHFGHGFFEYIALAGYFWMGFILILPFVFLVHDALKLALGKYISFDWRIAAAFAVLGAVLPLYAVFENARQPKFRRIELKVKNLPSGLEEVKIVQLADLHLDFHYKERRFVKILKRLAEEKPDLVVFTGDLLDSPGYCTDDMAEAVKSLAPPLGIFACPGNHEYYYGLKKSAECYKKLGIEFLVDRVADKKNYRIIGLSDMRTTGIYEADYLGIAKKHDSGKFGILLSHQPFYFDKIAENRDLLMLSAHTHRGQIFPFHFFVRLFYKFFYGLYETNGSFLYVTSGAGSWGHPMRLLAPPEIPLITLRAEETPKNRSQGPGPEVS